jgi:predicted alpha/beta superfamily hydrolase
MKPIVLCLINLLIVLPLTRSQDISGIYKIDLYLYAPSLPSDSSVYICGSIPQLAGWNPGKIRMSDAGYHTWKFTFSVIPGNKVEYKYTLGSWEKEGAAANGRPLPNFSIIPLSDTIIYDTIFFWTSPGKKTVQGKVTGQVEYLRDLGSDGIPPRDVIVWLPPGYDKGGRRYPVIYMHDGQNLFDPATSAFGVDWRLDESSDSLIRNRMIKPVIIVGIYNGSNRMNEYTPGAPGSDYMDFVINIVKPLVDKKYRTLPGRMHTFTGGSSAGGTISFLLAWEHTEIFSGALCLSPAFKINKIDAVKYVTAYSGNKKKLIFYIDNGGKDLEALLQPGVDEMLAALKMKGYREGDEILYIKEPLAEHNEAAWAKRIPAALHFFLGIR